MAPQAAERGTTLVYRPQRAALGVGCSRDCPAEELIGLVRWSAGRGRGRGAGGAWRLHAGSEGRRAGDGRAGRHLGLPLRLFTAAELEAETAAAGKSVGGGLCRGRLSRRCRGGGAGRWRAARRCCGLPKRKTGRATAALAVAPAPVGAAAGPGAGPAGGGGDRAGAGGLADPGSVETDRGGGGTGGLRSLSGPAGPARGGQGADASSRWARRSSAAGTRWKRPARGARWCWSRRATPGSTRWRRWCMNSLDRGGLSRAAQAVEVVVSPGISALQAAAARIGAPLGHDFCAISLSAIC